MSHHNETAKIMATELYRTSAALGYTCQDLIEIYEQVLVELHTLVSDPNPPALYTNAETVDVLGDMSNIMTKIQEDIHVDALLDSLPPE